MRSEKEIREEIKRLEEWLDVEPNPVMAAAVREKRDQLYWVLGD